MGNRWDKFLKRKEQEFDILKMRLTITIYGSYQPNSEKEFLIRQKKFLRNEKFAKTSLVIDFPNPSKKFSSLEISEHCLEFSDVNFLIFTKKGKRLGVVRELAHIAKSPNMIYKAADCVIFDQVIKGRSSVPSLSIKDIENIGIQRVIFSTEKDLQESLLSNASWYTRKFNPILKRRN